MSYTRRCVLLLLLAHTVAQAQDIEHVETPGVFDTVAMTEDKILGTLIETANEYEQYAPIPRFATSDITFPRDLEEYRALDGYGVLTISAVSQLAEELPFARVYFRSGERGIELTRIAEREVMLDEPKIVEVLGRYRYDAVYEFPMFIRATNVELIVDFAANRTGFVLTTFPLGPDPYEMPLEPPTAEHPQTSAVTAILEREVPLMAPYYTP